MKNAFEASGSSPTRGGLESSNVTSRRRSRKSASILHSHQLQLKRSQCTRKFTRAKFNERAKQLAHGRALLLPHLESIEGVMAFGRSTFQPRQRKKLIAEALGE